jgi:hypothetical protein
MVNGCVTEDMRVNQVMQLSLRGPRSLKAFQPRSVLGS